MTQPSGSTLAERRKLFLERNKRRKSVDFVLENDYMDDNADNQNSSGEINEVIKSPTNNGDDKNKMNSFSARLSRTMNQNMSTDENESNATSRESDDLSSQRSDSKISVLSKHPTVFPKSRPLFHQMIMAEQSQPLKVKESDVASLMKASSCRFNRLGSPLRIDPDKATDAESTLHSIQSEGPTIQDLSPEDESELTGTFIGKLSDEENTDEENVVGVYDDEDLDDDENQSYSYFDIGELELPATEYKFTSKRQ